MSNSATYFMLSKLAWIAGDLAVMMLCEKWMQLLTGKASSIVIVMLVYYATIYVSSAANGITRVYGAVDILEHIQAFAEGK